MKLSKVEMTYFRCFESLDVELQPDINVIVGANGAGKSSILDAIAVGLYELVAANGGGGRRQRSLQGAALKPTDIFVDADAKDVTAGRKSFVQIRASAVDYYPVDGFPDKSTTGQTATIEWSQNISYSPPDNFSYDTSASERLSQIHRYFQNIWQEIRASSPSALIPLPAIAYYRAHRRINGSLELGDVFKSDISRTDAFTQALDASAKFSSMCQWLYLRENEELRARVDDREKGVDSFRDLGAVRHALGQTIEGLKRIYFDGRPPRLMADIQERQGAARTLEVAQLSDGYRTLLAVVLDFARRLVQANPSFPNPLEAPGILLIDEIELHLHPRWQQIIIPSFRSAFPNTQLIVSTHSPAVLTTVRREHIHLLGSDHDFERLPEDVGTYGAESSHVLAEVFGTHPRPPTIETVDELRKYLFMTEEGKHDSDDAKALRIRLEAALGRTDPDLQRADLRARQIAVLGRK